jgi:hypothetical protein
MERLPALDAGQVVRSIFVGLDNYPVVHIRAFGNAERNISPRELQQAIELGTRGREKFQVVPSGVSSQPVHLGSVGRTREEIERDLQEIYGLDEDIAGLITADIAIGEMGSLTSFWHEGEGTYSGVITKPDPSKRVYSLRIAPGI